MFHKYVLTVPPARVTQSGNCSGQHVCKDLSVHGCAHANERNAGFFHLSIFSFSLLYF